MSMIPRALGGLAAAVRARPGVFAGVAAGVLLLDVFLPPLVLSLARKPVDYFTVNPWLAQAPGYLVSDGAPLSVRLGKLWSLALFWFSSDSPYGVEWGFAVTVADLARFVLMALIVGAYFALWVHRRDRLAAAGWGRLGAPRGRAAQGGVLGVVWSALGVSTGGCTVMGCGAPVLPVVGLAFVGLSSTTLKWMAELSTVGTWIALAGMSLGVIYLGWRVGPAARAPRG